MSTWSVSTAGHRTARDVASGCRPGAGLHTRRPQHRLYVASRRLHGAIYAAVYGAGGGRRRNATGDPARRSSVVFPRRPSYRVSPARAAVSAMEALSGRPRSRQSFSSTCSRTVPRRSCSLRRARTTSIPSGWARPSDSRFDRNGEFNVYAYDLQSKEVRQVTRPAPDFPVLNIAAGGGHVGGPRAGRIPAPLLESGERSGEEADVCGSLDLRETRERFVRGGTWIRGASLSPSGARAAFEFRGDIVTVPSEKGDVRQPDADSVGP